MNEPTSAQGYDHAIASGLVSGLKREIIQVLSEHRRPMTASEIADKIPGHRINGINPRFAELQKLGLIASHRVRVCGVTGLHAKVWQIHAGEPQKPEKQSHSAKPPCHTEQVRLLMELIGVQARIIANQTGKLKRWGRPRKAKAMAIELSSDADLFSNL